MRAAIGKFRIDFRIFRSAIEFISAIDARIDLPTIISLDHDLSTPSRVEMGTGVDVCEALARLSPFASVIVATTNTGEGDRMFEILRAASWPVERIVPFDDLNWISQWAEIVSKLMIQSCELRRSTRDKSIHLFVDERTSNLLKRTNDVAILALIEASGELVLYEAHNVVDRSLKRFPGHRELLESGLAPGTWKFACSLVLRNGKIDTINRLSMVNSEPDFCMPTSFVDVIIELTRLSPGERFRVFPV